MATKFLVTSERDAEVMLKGHFRKSPIRAGSNLTKDERYWYCGSKRCVMKPTGTCTANGTKQYLVTVE
ncbi:hypothetical protein ATY36_13700 [Vibrio cidicii]|uniref:hypothetical protein n=2 Tax=Vibrio cidicii TaxID=1763883 RepID=UPI00077FE881|nr:hypothetical protein ATY36_13700 [Vibrio cidicii]